MKQREKDILNYLITHRHLISKKELADHHQVSVSTIRDEMKNLNKFLKIYDVKITSVRGSGVKIEGSDENIHEVLDKINTNKQSHLDRCYYIAYYLLTHKGSYIKVSELAEQFYLSQSAIRNDLDRLNKLLKNEKVVLEFHKGKGVQLVGEEKELRNFLSKILAIQADILDPYGFKSSYKTIQERIISICQLDIEPIHRYLRNTLRRMGLSLSDNSFNTLLLHIAISIIRIRQGNILKNDDQLVISFESIYQQIIHLCNKLEKTYGTHFSKSERHLIYQYLITSNDVLSGQEIYEDKNIRNTCQLLAKEIVQIVEDTRNIQIDDESIVDNLVVHLIPLTNRIANSVTLKNPLLNQIKQEYPDAYGISWMCNSLFKKYFGQMLQEDELAYLAIHIEAMIEQEKTLIRTIIVCSQGVGISQLLASKIQKAFNEIKIIDVIAENCIDKYKSDKIDLCISTFPVETNINRIIVNPLLYQQDYKKIQSFIDRYSLDKIKLFKKIHLETILHCDLNKASDVIHYVSEILSSKGYVESNYGEDVIEREEKCSTAIGCKIAIPHGYLESIKKSALCVVTLNQDILWGQDEVDLLIFLAVSREDVKTVNLKLRQLYQLLYQQEIHDQILQAKTKKEIEEILDI
ncbi:BglG family transcription antiterminator [Traorella massiliensis]|uniref:BglG family transcription antiterminator n=1 Tax=Traorella massiliensis TaxID=1903263 RepID=UPI0008F8E814|nr:PRD domain-containing protein [Traorella massiliensis]